MSKYIFWQKPQEANQVMGHRKASWLELFFDIYFVCAIAAIGHILVGDMTQHGLMEFCLTFIPVWWIWIGFTFYNERFETNGFENRFFTFIMMIAVAGMAIFAHHATSSHFAPFALAYALGRGFLGFLYLRASWHLPDFRKSGLVFGLSFVGSALIIALAALNLSTSAGLAIFAGTLVYELMVPFLAGRFQGIFKKAQKLNLSHKVNERFGLFCIIVIGELIVAVIGGLSGMEHPGLNDFLLGIAGLSVALGMWWIYFDFISRRGPSQDPIRAHAWSYAHMPLVMSFVGLSAGILYSIKHPGPLDQFPRMIIAGSAGITFLVIGFIEIISHRHSHEPTQPLVSLGFKCFSGVSLLGVGLFSQVDTMHLLLLILGNQLVQMGYGMWVWFHIPDNSPYHTEYHG